MLKWFQEAFSLYLPSVNRNNGTTPINTGEKANSGSGTATPRSSPEVEQNPNENELCSAVTVSNPGSADHAGFEHAHGDDEGEVRVVREHKADLLTQLSQSANRCPPLPKGVRLIQYAPKRPPVAIDTCSIVVDVERFVHTELQELNARLHSPVQIRGGWGVFAILDRLRQVGLQLEIVTRKSQE